MVGIFATAGHYQNETNMKFLQIISKNFYRLWSKLKKVHFPESKYFGQKPLVVLLWGRKAALRKPMSPSVSVSRPTNGRCNWASFYCTGSNLHAKWSVLILSRKEFVCYKKKKMRKIVVLSRHGLWHVPACNILLKCKHSTFC